MSYATYVDTMDKAVEYFKDHPEEFDLVMEEMYDVSKIWDGTKWYKMEEFNDYFKDCKPEILAWYLEDSEVCTRHKYWRFSDDCHLESSNSKDYYDFLDRAVVGDLYEYYEKLTTLPQTVKDMFKKCEEEG